MANSTIRKLIRANQIPYFRIGNRLLFNREQIDNLIDIYFDGMCQDDIRIKIYCYIAACGLLWSNWCEFKRNLGVEFGEYSLRQYRFAKDYYKYAIEGIGGKKKP